MPDKFTIEVKGLRELEAKINSLPELIRKETSGHLQRGAQIWVRNAKRDAPVNYGRLKGGISFLPNPVTGLKVEVVSSAEYSPYVEWGTKGKYRAIPGTEQYAATFQGKGTGSFKEMLADIKEWVRKKHLHTEGLEQSFGKDQEQFLSLKARNRARKKRGLKRITNEKALERLAYVIAISILKNGVTPHPFFFKQMPIAKEAIETGLQAMAKSLKV